MRIQFFPKANNVKLKFDGYNVNLSVCRVFSYIQIPERDVHERIKTNDTIKQAYTKYLMNSITDNELFEVLIKEYINED